MGSAESGIICRCRCHSRPGFTSRCQSCHHLDSDGVYIGGVISGYWRKTVMSSFAECEKLNSLVDTIDEQYSSWGHFTEEAAQMIVFVASKEKEISKSMEAYLDLATLLAVTWMNESTFDTHPHPNTNNHPEDPGKWDIGPCQLNSYWTRMAVDKHIVEPPALGVKVFGDTFYEADGVTPCQFTGDPIANLNMCARVLMSLKGNTDEKKQWWRGMGVFSLHTEEEMVAAKMTGPFLSESEMRAVCYTGPGAQPHRLEDWRKYEPLFRTFFQCFA